MTAFYHLDPAAQARLLADLAQRALRRWGIEEARLDLIKFRENAVFKVLTAAGDRHALRIHRHGYHSDAELRSEIQWIQALAHDGVDVPAIVPTANGELFAVVQSGDIPEPRQVDLFEWIDGRQLGSVEGGLNDDPAAIAAIYRTVGELAARVHNQATGWTPPAGFVRHRWDADGLAGETPLWGRFWKLAALSPAQRELLIRTRDRVHRDLRTHGQSADGYSLIHADFAPENLLVDGDRVRLIDFDDAGFGWHLFEIATSLYFLIEDEVFDAAREAMISGYRAHRPLSDEQLEHLPLFFVARGLTYLGWVHTRPETETARELTPVLIEAACGLAEAYLSS